MNARSWRGLIEETRVEFLSWSGSFSEISISDLLFFSALWELSPGEGTIPASPQQIHGLIGIGPALKSSELCRTDGESAQSYGRSATRETEAML